MSKQEDQKKLLQVRFRRGAWGVAHPINSVRCSLNKQLLGLTVCPGTGLSAGDMEMRK